MSGINTGPVLAVLALIAYIGFEAFAVKRASHRMEPAYIHNMLTETSAAIEFCNAAIDGTDGKFKRTLQRVTERFKAELVAGSSAADGATIDQSIANLKNSAYQRTREVLKDSGCSSQVMKNHLQRYKIYARRSR